MKNKWKFYALALFTITSMYSCKGGASGEKSDSTMLDTQARDSAAGTNIAVHKADSAKNDTTKKDTAVKMK